MFDGLSTNTKGGRMTPTSWEWVREFPRVIEEEIRQFALTIGDNNPIHHDSKAARDRGLRDVVAPGVMVVGYLSSTIADEIPGVLVTEINRLQFKNPLYAGVSPVVHCAREHSHGHFVRMRFEIYGNSDSFSI